jgi:hypothetical protein
MGGGASSQARNLACLASLRPQAIPPAVRFPSFFAFGTYVMCTYIYVNVQEKDSCPYTSASPHPWSSARCFSSEGCLPQIVMTVSSLEKGAASPSVGASSISMTQGSDPMVMKLFIRPQSQSLCMME